MKRKIFIGSSKEGHNVAEQIKNEVNKHLGDWIECETWQEGKVFSQNKNTLDCLVKASRRYDYGILVASKDDITFKRFRLYNTMRDNVLFETGLFMGSLGLQRAFLITSDNISLPSDYSGVTIVKYNKKNLNNKIETILAELEKTKGSFNLKPLPSAALAFGYYESFVLDFSKKQFRENPNFQLKILLPANISDIDAQKELYIADYPSTETQGGRPVANEYNDEKNCFWDIPTTLNTIYHLTDYIIPSTELGINIEKDEWIQHELRNFAGTLETLIHKQGAYKKNIKIEFL
ncbi:MAG: nucleotide-binding protein [Bacteroidales bacterium]|nr:nucleotide-binding protein [Bacteroidales bacterium]